MIAVPPIQKKNHRSDLISLSFKRYIFQMWVYMTDFSRNDTTC